MIPRRGPGLCAVLVCAGLAVAAPPAFATEQVIFGPVTHTRTTGPPNQFTDTFALPSTLIAPFRLHVQNGNPDGSHRISSATITLNGTQVAGPSDFNQQVAGFDKTVTLQANNTLQVRLASAPGSFLVITVFGTVPPPTLTSLLPPSLPITQGHTGTLTATITPAQPTPTTIALSSDNTNVATMPATATVPANQTSVGISVTGVAPGTATITATLNNTSAHSTVTVSPAGPSITSLLPATLQITQGASGTLTVTISAAQGSDTVVNLTSSDATIVGLPPTGTATVPAGQTSQTFAVFGNSPGSATITATLNGTSAHSQVTVVIPLPTVVSLLPHVLPLTEGSSGTLTVTLNATQPTDTDVALSTSDATIVGLPPGSKVTVPAHALSAAFAVSGLHRGMATVTASLNGTSATAAIEVQPPPPTVQALSCPATVTVSATALCTLTLNATQLTDTVVPLASSAPGFASVPPSVTVPATALTAQFAVTGVTVGSATITAGPLNGTSKSADAQILPPPPTIVSLLPASATIFVGATANLTLTLNAAQLSDTSVALASSAPGTASVPPSVTVPAGSLTATVVVTGAAPGSATITAGPLNATQAQSSITVNQLPPTVTALTPATLSLPKGKAGTLTVTIAPTQPTPTIVPLASSDPSVGVPVSVTVPAGASTAAFPVLANQIGSATITAGPLNGTSQTATVTVTPPELVSLAVAPATASLPKGTTQAFAATGTFTDNSTQDETGSAAWTSSDPTVATITSPGGVATGVGQGSAQITAAVGAIVSPPAMLTVTPAVPATLAVSPANPTRALGQTLQFQATGTLTDGTTQDLTAAVTWTSSNTAVATITSPGGLATALTVGSSTITATHAASGLTASTTLTVVGPPSLASFSPTSGRVGDQVTLTGTNFIAVSGVTFNGAAASGFTVFSATSIQVNVPAGATTGPIAVTTVAGTANSTGSFVVLPTQDFQVTGAPATVVVPSAGQGSFTVSLTGAGGFTGLATLTLSGVPTGSAATFAAPTLTAAQSTLLNVATNGTTPAGSYPLTITATGTVNGAQATRSAQVTVQVQPGGQTSLSGQVLDENANPVKGALIKLGTLQTSADDGGNFLLLNPPVGPDQLVFIDGGPASSPGRSLPLLTYKVTIVAGQTSTLGFTPYLHFQKTSGLVDISNSSIQRAVTDPDLPGFQVAIPAGVTITGWDGQPNTQMSIRRVPLDRSPLPPAPAGLFAARLYMYYFNKQGGGTPSAPVPITFPNDVGAPPGTQLALYFFDEAPDGSRPNQWAQYGTGTVSPDGTQVVPDTDPATGKPFGQPRFCCGATFVAWAQSQRGSPLPPARQRGVDPVDLATGIFVLEKTDMVLPGRIPIVFTRTYRTNGAPVGPFGPGTSQPYNVSVQPSPPTLVFPEGVRVRFSLQPDGTYQNTTDPAYRGAVLTPPPPHCTQFSGPATLRFKEGTVWSFGGLVCQGDIFDTLNALYLTAQTDRNGNTVTITRGGDPAGTVVAVGALAEPSGRKLTFTYDTASRITAITDPIGRTVRYGYDPNGFLATVTDPAGGVTRYTYDAQGRMLTISDPRGITFLTNEYDTNGRVARQTQADGGVWQVAYTSNFGVITQTVVTDPRGNRTTYRFNSQGYLQARTDALGQTTTFTRDPVTNLVLSTSDPLGRITRFAYDANGNMTSLTDPAGNIRTFTYEPTFNKITSITDPLGNVTRFVYDPTNGNLLTITNPLGAVSQIAYNSFGQPVTSTDPLRNATQFTYNERGDLASITDPVGNTTVRSYDQASRLVTQTDPRGFATGFSYNLLNRLTRIVDALNGLTKFAYDANGNLFTVTDARGNIISHEYDLMDRLSRRIDQLGAPETFTYDGTVNLLTTTDRKGQTSTFTYDALGRRTRSEFAGGAVVAFEYHPSGRMTRAEDTADPHGPILFAYDALDRLVSEQTALGTVTYQYDGRGRRTQMTVSGQAPVAYTYDANSRLRTITQAPLNPVDMEYDAANRRIRLSLPNGLTTEYQYDAASRPIALIYRNLTQFLGDLAFQYDASGNRLGIGGSFARTLLPDTVGSAAYDGANRPATFGGKVVTFDANGNLVNLTEGAAATIFTWDPRNRLVGLSGPAAAAFSYDPFGRRTQKAFAGQRTAFQYDGVEVVQEVGGGMEVGYLRGLAVDEPIGRLEAGTPSYYLADALGSIIALADGGGSLMTTYTYGPFGETASAGPASANAFQHGGRENDGTGLYYYRFRYYNPGLGRFINEDPIGLAAGVNLYRFALDNPLRFRDPLGLYTFEVGGGEQVGALARVVGLQQGTIAIDTQGNVAITQTTLPSGNFGPEGVTTCTACASGYGIVEVSNAPSVLGLAGPFDTSTATVNVPPTSAASTFVGGGVAKSSDVTAISIVGGAGVTTPPLPASYTQVRTTTEVVILFNVFDVFKRALRALDVTGGRPPKLPGPILPPETAQFAP